MAVMHSSSFLKRLFIKIIKTKQLMLLDGDSHKPAKSFKLRPISLIFFVALLLGLGAMISQYYFNETIHLSAPQSNPKQQATITLLQGNLAQYQAENSIKQAHINSLEAIITKQQKTQGKLESRLNILERIFKIRQGSVTQILQATLHNIDTKSVAFTIILVKGGNYPRRLRGSVQVLAHDKQGNEIKLLFNQKQDHLPYKVESHTFLHGTLYWPKHISRNPKEQQLTVLILDRKGKELVRTSYTIEAIS
ncbi:MAG: hypothetical protein R8K49_01835 [Mariprofundaceae bacterium]